MRYIDSSVDRADQSVALWMQGALSEGVIGFHCQAGYFTLEGASLLVPVLRKCAADGANIRLLLGSNQGSTLASHVSYLVGLLDLPRASVALGIVAFDDALFHPKVYHITRPDGSQTAYVGSANLTRPGIEGRNIEAGLVLDTRAGDNEEVLRQIVHNVDRWFIEGLRGLTKVDSVLDVDALLACKTLALQKVTTAREPGEEPVSGEKPHTGASRKSLFKLPSLSFDNKPPTSSSAHPILNSFATEEMSHRHFLRATEASYHFPQGVHIGHLLIILYLFSGDRRNTAFDDKFIRLNGELGSGRLSGYRRQVKYKMLAAMELGLLTDVRFLAADQVYVPKLTKSAVKLWRKLSSTIDLSSLKLDAKAQSTKTPKQPRYYNEYMRGVNAGDAEVRALWYAIVKKMVAFRLMVRYLFSLKTKKPISKPEIYKNFFGFAPVIEFCNAVGIEPQTATSAAHRLPFLLNLLDSCGVIEQNSADVQLSQHLDVDMQEIIGDILANGQPFTF